MKNAENVVQNFVCLSQRMPWLLAEKSQYLSSNKFNATCWKIDKIVPQKSNFNSSLYKTCSTQQKSNKLFLFEDLNLSPFLTMLSVLDMPWYCAVCYKNIQHFILISPFCLKIFVLGDLEMWILLLFWFHSKRELVTFPNKKFWWSGGVNSADS